jgi:hypothetical protein
MIITLHDMPDQLQQSGKNGREFVVRNFSRERLTVQYHDLLAAVTSAIG